MKNHHAKQTNLSNGWIRKRLKKNLLWQVNWKTENKKKIKCSYLRSANPDARQPLSCPTAAKAKKDAEC